MKIFKLLFLLLIITSLSYAQNQTVYITEKGKKYHREYCHTTKNSNTKYMIHNINYLVSDISKGMTLEAGDIIATGTPGGVGMSFNPPKYMKSGDKITCCIDEIGELINFVE